MQTTDPMEMMIEAALIKAGIKYRTDMNGGNPVELDFYLPEFDIHIEVKQFHTNRIAEQMSRAPNVIVAQGRMAVEWLAKRIAGEPAC